MRCVLGLLAILGGCTWVYDSQYDDRRAELEEARTEFLPGDSNVSFITGAGDKLFWVDVLKPIDVPMLHSYNPATQQTIDYAWSSEMTIDEEFHYSSELVVECTFSVNEAYDANAPDRLIASTSMGSSQCSVDGNRVYFLQGREVFVWTPGSGEPALAVDLDMAGVGSASIGGFAVEGDTLVLVEGGDLWRVDLATKRGTWMMNEMPVGGTVLFDQTGVVYQHGYDTVVYRQFADLATTDLTAAIADGGYHLTFKHDDVHTLAGTLEFALHGRHLIYRGTHGIFAYGFDSKKVIDLLLDTGSEDFGAAPVYHQPAVTTDGTLFVIDDNNYGANETPVYRVDIKDRLL